MIDIDYQLFQLINGANNHFFDFIMFWLSDKLIWIPLYAFLIFLLYKDFGKNFWKPLLLVILSIALADLLSVHLFKNVFLRLRPCHTLKLEGIVHLVHGKCGGQYGFVSSHAANSSAIAVSLFLTWFRKRSYLGYALLVWALLVSYSRVYIGVHFPADIMGGLMLGSLIATCLFVLAQKGFLKFSPLQD